MDKNIFQKILEVEKLIHATLPKLKGRELYLALDHTARYCNGTRKVLTEDEKVIYDLLLRHNYSHRSVMLWMQGLKLPEDLQEDVKKGLISYHKAMQTYRKRRNETEYSLEKEILEDIRTCLKDLQKADHKRTPGVV